MAEKSSVRKRAKRLASETLRDWGEHNVRTYASSIAFYFFLSIIPLIIILLQLLPIVGISMNELLTFIDRLIPETAHQLAATIVFEAYFQSRGILSLSALILIWAASQGTMALRRGLNRVYDERETRSFPVLCVLSIWYTMAMLVIMALMLFLVFMGPVSRFLTAQMPEFFMNPLTIAFRDIVVIQGLVVLAFALLYTALPAGSRNFFRQIPGAVLVTVVWYAFSYVFSIYVQGSNAYTMFYGSLGTIAIMLFWLYCCFYILLIGAFFNRLCGEKWDRLRSVITRKNRKK